jgi:hypothetical protein
VSFASIALYVASQRVFIVASVYFFIDAVRKLLDTPSYNYLLQCYVDPCLHSLVYAGAADGGQGPQAWKEAAADKSQSFILGVGRGINNALL